MADVINIKKGLDINLDGQAVKENIDAKKASIYSLTTVDYHKVVFKVVAKAGTKVKAGTPLLIDKNHPEVNFVSPISGEVSQVVRGEKRKLLNVLVKADGKNEYEEFDVKDWKSLSGEEVKALLCKAGLWSFIKQRPYDLIADTNVAPRDIFVTGFDSNPLAPDYSYLLKGKAKELQAGIDALSKMTKGKVYLSLPFGCTSQEMKNAKNVEINYFKGKNPIGNVGVQINNLAPVNKGEHVWTLSATNLIFIGRLLTQGKVDLRKTIAVTGPEVKKPQYVNTIVGAPISSILEDNIKGENPIRIINGNCLTGVRTSMEGYLDSYASQITVLHEGKDVNELFGWVRPRLNMFSASRTYFSFLRKKATYSPDTRILGGKRALIMSGEYDKVFPMDILPEQLVRACITRDYEGMENLGIYEVAPEDFALCEFVCTSKVEVQKEVREALDDLKKENGD